MTIKKSLSIAIVTLVASSAFAAGSTGVEKQTQEFLDKLAASGDKPLEQMSPKAAREALSKTQSAVKVDLSGIEIEDKTITVDGKPLLLKVVRPENTRGDLPAFMFFHGGGWVLGDYPTHERLIRDLVVGSGTAAIYVDYTPSPEAQYPVANQQAYAATQWVSENGDEIGIDGSRLAVAGNSVGGNMATVVSLMAKQKGTPDIRFQLLMWPVTEARFDTDSYNKYAEGHFLTKSLMQWFWDNYTTNVTERKQIYASPLLATTDQLKDLPPVLIQTAEMDVLRDEGEAYGQKLDAAGVDVKVVRYEGMIHDFGLLNPLQDVAGSKEQIEQASQALKQHLTAR